MLKALSAIQSASNSLGGATNRFRALVIFAAVVTIIASLAVIFAAGHPIISIWAALIIVGWLFIAGAAIGSGN
jgi:hypothetical protein